MTKVRVDVADGKYRDPRRGNGAGGARLMITSQVQTARRVLLVAVAEASVELPREVRITADTREDRLLVEFQIIRGGQRLVEGQMFDVRELVDDASAGLWVRNILAGMAYRLAAEARR